MKGAKGGHAMVFGASSGLGKASAHALRLRGFTVSGLARRRCDQADASFECDVTKDESVDAAVTAAIAANGTPRVVVYASGAAAMGRALSVPAEAARAAFEVSFWGFERAVRAALPKMMEAGTGSMVLVSSLAALRPVPHEAHYAAAKAAAARYAGCVALEAQKAGVRVQALHVGYVDTGFLESAGWFGMPAPKVNGSGVTPDDVGDAICRLVETGAPSGVLGWRERAIALADRIAPNLYDRLLRSRG